MNDNKYYYLRKIDSEGGDRALYKHNFYNRFYRQSYPTPEQKCMKLYKVKRLSTILRQRNALHDYCNEWFDVYDQDNNIINLEKEV